MPYKDPKTYVKRLEGLKQHVILSIIDGNIIDQYKWNVWCNKLKSCAKKKHPYSEDFTNERIFEMMKTGCYYCGDIIQ